MPQGPATLFPATRAHAGVWEGTYTHLRADSSLEDRHDARVECLFPDDGGDVFYRQKIRFTWPDGRVRTDMFEGRVRNGCLWYDTPSFAGYSWRPGTVSFFSTFSERMSRVPASSR